MNELHVFQDKTSHFYAVIALQGNGRGPAIGGCRIRDYASINLAIDDAIRLSEAMRYKAAISGLPHDGGKAVILSPKNDKHRIEILKQFAACVDSLNGKYITTIDSGTNSLDMNIIKQSTPFVTGHLSEEEDNPSFSTAKGIFYSMQAGARLRYGCDTVYGLHIAVQGVGQVGYLLCKLLHEAGAHLSVSDTNPLRVLRCIQEFNAKSVLPSEIVGLRCDIFSPCALGQVINPTSIREFNTKLIAGAANDQLQSPELAEQLAARGILYLPDFVINAGGLIHLSLQWQHSGEGNEANQRRIDQAVKGIADRILGLAQQARDEKKTVLSVAMREAEKVFAENVFITN